MPTKNVQDKPKVNVKEINDNFIKFLKKYEIKKDGKDKNKLCTHFAFGEPWGKFSIPEDKLDKFYELYCLALSTKKIELHIVERPKKVGPLLLDIDFKFGKDNSKRCYTEDHIKYVISCTNTIVKKYIDCKESNLKAFVFEKEKPTTVEKQKMENGKKITSLTYKDGFHIMYPYLALSTLSRYLIIDETSKLIFKNKYFEDIPFINEISDIFDKSIVANNGWMMYGSRKHDGFYYYFKKIFKCDMDEMDDSKFKHNDLIKLLSNRKYDDDDEMNFKDNLDKKELDNKIKNIIKINNIKQDKPKIEKKENIFERNNNSDNDTDNDYNYDNNNSGDNTNNSSELDSIKSGVIEKHKNKVAQKLKDFKNNEIKTAKKLVEILSIERATNYHLWIRVGWALHNIDDSLLDTWKEFSKKCPDQYDEDKCDKIWDKARNTGLTFGSLRCWAREDSYEKYTEIIRENINDVLNNAETGTEYDIAKVVHEMYKDSYVCTDIKNSIWYEFKDHKWKQVQAAYTLSNKISEELTKEFAILNSFYYAQIGGKDANEQEKLMKKAANINKIMIKLKTSFKNNILKECANLFYDPEFEEKLDGNRDLIGFTNGVYDLESRIFRNGTPDDYVSLTVGYDYVHYEPDHKYIREIKEYFNKVQRDEDMRNYILTLLASYLDGHTKQQQFIIWTGSGSNGKSTSVEFFQLAFGEYCGVLPITVLTKKRGSSSAATPEMANLRGKRFVVFQEPENDDQIYVGYMKELTGGDWIYARPLFRDPIRFKPQFKLLLTCNKLPYIPSTDGGTWRRLRVSPWESEFIDGKVKYPHQFKKDYNLGEKMEKWKKAFMFYLINTYYPKFKQTGISSIEPEKVKIFTKKYKKQSDVLLEYIEKNLAKTNNKEYESIDTLYGVFKNWYSECYSVKTIISKKEFQEYLENNNYELKNNNLYGYCFKEPGQDQDIDEKNKDDIDN